MPTNRVTAGAAIGGVAALDPFVTLLIVAVLATAGALVVPDAIAAWRRWRTAQLADQITLAILADVGLAVREGHSVTITCPSCGLTSTTRRGICPGCGSDAAADLLTRACEIQGGGRASW